MINSAQITEFMDVVFINMWDKDSSRLVFCVGDLEIVRGVKKDFAYADKEHRKKKVTMLTNGSSVRIHFLGSVLTGSVKSEDPMSPYQEPLWPEEKYKGRSDAADFSALWE